MALGDIQSFIDLMCFKCGHAVQL